MGSNEARLEASLREEDFKIDEKAKSAEYEWSWYPCLNTLVVDWKSDVHGKITWINGRYGLACL